MTHGKLLNIEQAVIDYHVKHCPPNILTEQGRVLETNEPYTVVLSTDPYEGYDCPSLVCQKLHDALKRGSRLLEQGTN